MNNNNTWIFINNNPNQDPMVLKGTQAEVAQFLKETADKYADNLPTRMYVKRSDILVQPTSIPGTAEQITVIWTTPGMDEDYPDMSSATWTAYSLGALQTLNLSGGEVST